MTQRLSAEAAESTVKLVELVAGFGLTYAWKPNLEASVARFRSDLDITAKFPHNG
ncbi:MAG: hypothetical protein WBA18_06540 [Terracidiphilus sp.]